MAVTAYLWTERPPVRRVAALSGYRWLVVGTVCIGALLGQLDASIAGLVLPTLEEVFHVPVASVEWVAIAYLLTLAALVVPFGRLADMVGRKLLYVYGFLVFIAGSALCGFAPTLGWLVAFRVLQAVGAAMLQANSVAIIAAASRPRELGKAIGIQGAAQAVGLAVGPSVGGMLIAMAGWRWVFLIAVPFGLAGALLGWLVLPQSTPASARSGHAAVRRERFDWLGAALFAVAIVAALVALTYANSWGLTSTRFVAVGALAGIALAVFLAVERRAAHPLVDLSLFRRRLFSAGITAGLLSYAVLFGALFLVPFYLERILGHTPNEAGLLLSPVPVALGVVAPLSGVVTDRLGSRLPTVVGMVLAGLALAGLAAFALVPLPMIVVLLGALGIGLGLFTPPNNSAIMSSAPSHRLGVAGGILNMTRSLGTSLGVALTGAILAAFLAAETGTHVEGTVNLAPATLAPAFRATALFLAVLAALAAVISLARGPRPESVSAGAPASAAGTGQSDQERRERQLAGAEALGV